MATDWVDFKAIKATVTMQMVLDHYGVSGLKQTGEDLRGPCPIHKGAPSSKHLSVNLRKNAFKCFSGNCGAAGNVLDFVAAMEKCSVRDAALKLDGGFKVGDSDIKSEESISISPKTIESMERLVLELEVYAARIAHHASKLLEQEVETTALKEKVVNFLKEVR